MKAVVHAEKIGLDGLTLTNMDVPTPAEGEVRVKLKTAGLNHRDLFVPNRHKLEDGPLILGSDGAGIVDEIGPGVEDVQVGAEVIINPGLGWKENTPAPPEGFEIVGLPFHGTFANYIIVPAENVLPKPSHLNWNEAGVLSLAALTAYRALFTRGQVKQGMNVLIPGIGSGVATFLLQFAKAVGATVYVTSRSEAKRQKALELGADVAIDSAAEDWEAALNGVKMDLVIECVGAATFNKSLAQLKKGGTIVTFGSSTGDTFQFDLRSFFYGQYNLLGSTMGSGEELEQMLEFISTNNIKPVVDTMYTLDEFEAAFDRINKAEQLGKMGFIIEK
ncbi:zinc-binding dehydrogenase [Sutcliffiella sp. NC1]|uniref:zinc-binding dehydrogenase n=1 Tax=Sutcliffiella sp. NC1 TaxID=3004096 RepID=UPI0022DE5CAF|nr:zinc-binding dehydrogenase [Sutcliffiella sp. NC1]WBL14878.1 zinc-binding dehydrogenase [Sutcliffiella sp. NC1]